MEFLVLFLVLAAYKFLGWRPERNWDSWFVLMADWLASHLGRWPRITLLTTLLLPVLLVSLLLLSTRDLLFGLVGIALQAVILFYSFGRDNLIASTQAYLDLWRQGSTQTAYHYAAEHFHIDKEFAADDLDSMQHAVRVGLFCQWFEQVFLVLFWYLLAGPLAALFIRLLCLYDESERWGEKNSTPLQLKHFLEWLPARLLGFTFSLAGNFVPCVKCWMAALNSGSMQSEQVLHDSGIAALGGCVSGFQDGSVTPSPVGDEVIAAGAGEIEMVQNLLIRSLVVWVVIVAILVIV